MGIMTERFSRAEIRKDAAQEAVQAASAAVGEVTTIVTGAVRDVAGALGRFATEVFEIRDAARRAAIDSTPPDQLEDEAHPTP
jgi:hypothetical protein